MTTDEPAATEREFDAMLARSGLRVPDELRAGTLAGYGDLRRLAELVHRVESPEDEPAAVYRMAVGRP
jgi:hypothetical protein